MGIISIKDLKADMVLFDDVKDCRGRLLLCKGTVLKDNHLRLCKMWGIVEADVQGISDEDVHALAGGNLDAAAVAAAQDALRERLRHNDMDHPAVRELFRLCYLRAAEGKQINANDKGPVSLIKEEFERSCKGKPLNVNPAKFIGDDTRLATLPDLYRQLLEAVSNPDSSTYDIENVISRDTGLSARLLKIVNSAFYAYPFKVDTLSQAINIVGTKQLSAIAVGVDIITAFKDIPSEIMNMTMFWKHSVLCGICARIIAGYKNIRNTERLFVAGLLHDIGRLIAYNYWPRESLCALVAARDKRSLLYLAERDLFDSDHAIVGGDLLKEWQMSMSLEDAVRCHHEPQKSRVLLESSIVHLADIAANAMGIGSSGEVLIPSLDKEAWMCLGLTTNILSLTMERAEHQVEGLFALMYGDDKSKH